MTVTDETSGQARRKAAMAVLAPLRAAIVSERKQKAAETAATRVDFYTMVRGEG